jgi:hypothetical protein
VIETVFDLKVVIGLVIFFIEEVIAMFHLGFDGEA